VEFGTDDRLLICTDGLTDMLSDEVIAEELARHASPQAACDALIRRALEAGGRDNVTAVMAAPAFQSGKN
jgi:protein phosphatase